MRGKLGSVLSGDGRTGAPSGAAGPAGRTAAVAAAATSPGEDSRAGMQGAGLRQRAHPTQRRAGAGGAAAAGPRRPRGGSGAENVSGSRRPAPWWGRGARGIRVGAARECALVGARGRACLYSSGARALWPSRCAWPLTCAFPARMSLGSRSCSLWAAAASWGARPEVEGRGQARAVLLGGGTGATARRTPSCGGGAAADGQLAV